MFTLLKSTDHRVMPWANGGGKTTEIALWPPHATLAERNFNWRISIAHVAEDGPFSRLDGYERILTVISGNGITLDAGDRGVFSLGGLWEQARFQGDWALDGRLHDGPIDDLNVMVRRDRCRATVEVVILDQGDPSRHIVGHEAATAMIALKGVVTVEAEGNAALGIAPGVFALGQRDALIGTGKGTPDLTFRGEPSGVVAVIRFDDL